MSDFSLEEFKKASLEVLDAIVKFCDERGIGYFLNYGTLLGAIRHKGYIPWDDDIDIGMLRPDYDKFVQAFTESPLNYDFINGDALEEHGLLMGNINNAKAHFAGIDIFCMDNAPDNELALKIMLIRYSFYRKLFAAKRSPINRKYKGRPLYIKIFGKLASIAVRLIPLPMSYFKRKVWQTARMYNHENTRRVGCFQMLKAVVIDRELIANTIYAEFEGKQYKIPAGYDEWLRKNYGDYMKLPPKHMQVPKHH